VTSNYLSTRLSTIWDQAIHSLMAIKLYEGIS
jgi:hypothetical protein